MEQNVYKFETLNDNTDAQPGETEVRFPALFRAMDFEESSLAKILIYLASMPTDCSDPLSFQPI